MGENKRSLHGRSALHAKNGRAVYGRREIEEMHAELPEYLDKAKEPGLIEKQKRARTDIDCIDSNNVIKSYK